jgi:hypothetical protein
VLGARPAAAGLAPQGAGDLVSALEFEDDEALMRRLLSLSRRLTG